MRISRSIKRPFRAMPKKFSLATILLFLWVGLYQVIGSLQEREPPSLPPSFAPAALYANELGDSLPGIYQKAISEAKQSIVLVIYSLTDRRIIDALKEKHLEGLSIFIVVDGDASPGISRKLPGIPIIRRCGQGLTHQKILILDDQKILLGSTNLTPSSLKIHNNLVVGLNHPDLAKTTADRIRSMDEDQPLPPTLPILTEGGGQAVELWLLPNPEGSQKILQLIHGAKKTIRVAMFTWTRTDFADAIITASKRGVDVQVVIDRRSGKGASAKVVKLLEKHKIFPKLNTGEGLMHNKYMCIDDTILVNGSANWTYAAFTKNDDFFMLLNPLTAEQSERLSSLWNFLYP